MGRHLSSQSAISLELSAAAARVGRREIFLWVVISLFANQALLLVDLGSYRDFVASLVQQNYIYWLACYAVIYRLYASDRGVRATRFDCWLALAICGAIFFTSFLPHRFEIGLLATFTAGYFLFADGEDRNTKAAGAVLLALAVNLVWAPIVFQLFTPELLGADAAIVGVILAELRPDIVWSGTSFLGPDGHAISLIAGCSSFNNVSLAVLACAAIVMLRRTEWVRRDVAAVIIASVAMILVNATRICLLGWSAAFHQYWHDGAGAQILGISETLIVLLIAWWGTAPRRRAP
jgi:exosortase/archaeosortase family protein